MIEKPKSLNKDAFERDLKIIWDGLENENFNRSFDNFINNFNELLSCHVPIQRMSNKTQMQSKP